MKEKILYYLEKLEKEKDIQILLACETGSRAWGFPSPDSDFDIRIIYKHKKNWYLSLNEQKDSIDLMFEENEIDITGWDLRKSLKLLFKSNVSMLERIQSPIIYKENKEFVEEIKELAQNSYSKIATIHHHLNLAKGMFRELNSESYKLKKLFYVLRSTASCQWILERNEIPPIVFTEVLDGISISESNKNRILELIDLKAAKNESYFHSREEILFEYIKETWDKAKKEAKKLPSGNGNMDELNKFFIKTLD